MNYQAVRLVSTFESSPKVEPAAVSSFGFTQNRKLYCRRMSSFGPFPLLVLHTLNQQLVCQPFSLLETLAGNNVICLVLIADDLPTIEWSAA